MNFMTRLWRQDLAWAGVILVMAAAIGLWQGQRLIPLSNNLWDLKVQMEERRAQRQGFKGIALARAYDLFQKGEVLFIDARPASEYAVAHIPRALNLTLADLEEEGAKKIAGIAKNQEMVVYCSSVDCEWAQMVVQKLEALGFTQIVIFWDGLGVWETSGYPVDKS
jgi:rhodanese-related sulfurtransferase